MTQEKPRQLNLNFETVGSIVAMFIGVTALFVAWDQAQVMRKQQHASVWPLLATDFTIDAVEDGFMIDLSVANKGVGPALVESANLIVDDERISGKRDLMQLLFGEALPSGKARLNGASIENTTVGAGDTVTVFRVVWPETEENAAAFAALANRYVTGGGPDVSMTTCYCSVFDRCYTSNGRDRPQSVKDCPEPTDFFSTMLQSTQANAQ